uniref:Fibronectin leucine rich transmembrane protein 1 n=1 Tax=Poecilia latipinna TaxID=48699 RepID=A0A3B3W2T4_9TELE
KDFLLTKCKNSLERSTSIRVIYLYANQLDEFPIHLPPSLKELHLQDNNIRTLPRSALAKLPLLERLHLDDNSISTVSIQDRAFSGTPRLRLLFLSRNHLSSIPAGLPASLEELRLDDNRISTIPTHAFRGLSSLLELLLLRGNPWNCGCNLRWLHSWLHGRGSAVTVRGLVCQGPESVRGQSLRDLTSLMEQCEGPPAGSSPGEVVNPVEKNGGGEDDVGESQVPQLNLRLIAESILTCIFCIKLKH